MTSEIDRERTLVIVKPDGVQRGLIGKVIGRFEQRGFKIVGLKMMKVTPEIAEKHYGEHKEKPFYESLVNFITMSPVVVLALEGRDVVRLVRNMMGALKPEDATPGSIRGDFALSKSYNVVHGSDSPENGLREVGIFFSDDELMEYDRDCENWMKHDD